MAGSGAAAFTLAKGQISGPINTGPNGVLLQVTDKAEPAADEIAKGLGPTRDKLLETRRNELFNTYAEQLLSTYEKAGAIVLTKKAPASPLGN
jgi:peptidyl-prolyl cis-trans isomerase D